MFTYMLQPVLCIALSIPLYQEVSVNSLAMSAVKSMSIPELAALLFSVALTLVCYAVASSCGFDSGLEREKNRLGPQRQNIRRLFPNLSIYAND